MKNQLLNYHQHFLINQILTVKSVWIMISASLYAWHLSPSSDNLSFKDLKFYLNLLDLCWNKIICCVAFQKCKGGDAQKSAVASFDRCWEPWEPWEPVLYFMTRRWYKRASNLSRAGITISKPRKARHSCGQISGWHRFLFSLCSRAQSSPL